MSEINDFVYQSARTLPVILLLDTSGSMSENGKIGTLNSAVTEMLASFRELDSTNAQIGVAVVTFGGVAKVHTDLKPAAEISLEQMSASGGTPLGAALNLAKELVEDRGKIPSRAYRPIVVLVSDGMPNDSWEGPLEQFKTEGRAAKCYRMAMGIGVGENSAEYRMLKRFIDNEEKVYCASDARDIMKFFKYVTMSVAMRSRSQNPNVVPKPSEVFESDDDDDVLF